jgi:hypothetical protein
VRDVARQVEEGARFLGAQLQRVANAVTTELRLGRRPQPIEPRVQVPPPWPPPAVPMVSSDVHAGRLGLPDFADLPGNAFASVEAFLQFQRQAVAGARYAVELDADATWSALEDSRRATFRSSVASRAHEADEIALWRRAWWLHAIGGRPRAPFEIATPMELATLLVDALRVTLAPGAPPAELPREIDAWWTALTVESRARIAAYTNDRVAGAGRRLRQEGVLPGGQPAIPDKEESRRGKRRGRRPPSRAEIERVRAAGEGAVAAERALDLRFVRLGPVCGACTRETGGCCSLTVPLLWREADYRLLALGDADVPAPDPQTPGACPFLGPQGCRLPSERRPHICRTFLCERAEAALGDDLGPARTEIEVFGAARSQLAL